MKNVWKGLAVGAFAGAIVGVAIDIVESAGRKAADVSNRAASGVSSSARSGATHFADLVEEKIDDWDVTKKVEYAKDEVGQVFEKGRDALKRK
ncbi:MAG: hypothetical protein WEA34_04445 [Gemmatimonadota bacterium]